MTLSLARRADRYPDRTAVVDISEERLYAPAETIHERRVSYADLARSAAATADRLAELGIDAGDTVCLVTRNRVASLALLFACRRLGATFAPISHRLTPVTVERPFEVLEPSLVVAESAQRDLVRSLPFDRTVTLSELAAVDVDAGGDADTDSSSATESDSPSVADATDPRVGDDQTDADRPLLLLHGRGGRPIVRYTARSLEWNCIATLVTWGLSPRDTVPLVSPLSAHDGLVRTALPALYAGGRLLLDRAFDPGDTLTAIESENATLLTGRTAAFRDLAAQSEFPEAADSIERAFPDASVPEDALEPYREQGIPVARTHGRLECPIAFGQSAGTANGAAAADDGVGKPVPDCRVRLLDDADPEDGDADATVGETAPLEGPGTGQLVLSGPVLADGYVGGDGADSAASADSDDDATDVDAGFGTGDRTNDHSDETADRGRFVEGWFQTGEPFRRDERGRYARAENAGNEQ